MFFTIPIATRLEATAFPRPRLPLAQLRALRRRLTDAFLFADDEYGAPRTRLLHLARLRVVAPDGVCHRHTHRVVSPGRLCVFI
jgi:hypothetical protein